MKALWMTGAAFCGAYGYWLLTTGGAGLVTVASVGVACAIAYEVSA